MSPVLVGLVCAAFVFSGALLGMTIQRRLASHHLSKEMQDLVKLSAGMIATLTALVLGLLVSSAKSSFDVVNAGLVQGSANVIYLDHTLARYGPEAAPVREQLRRVVTAGLATLWPDEHPAGSGVATLERGRGMDPVQDQIAVLKPGTDVQRAIYAQLQQLAAGLGQSRWILIEQTHAGLPLTLLVVLVFWLALLFVSFGLFAPRSRMSHVVLLIGAMATSAAIVLVLELEQPFDGLIRVSSEPLRDALAHLGE